MHPDNVDEIQVFAEEAGAQAVRGILRYPAEHGGFSVGRKNLEEWLCNFWGQEVLLVVASLGEKDAPILCGLCGSQYGDTGCPSCQGEAEAPREFVEWHRDLFKEIGEFLDRPS